MVLGFLGTLLLLFAGYHMARGLWDCPIFPALVLGFPCALFIFLAAINGSLRLEMGWTYSTLAGLGLLGLLAAWGRLQRREEPCGPSEFWRAPWRRWEGPLLAVCVLVLWCTTAAGQLSGPDDDYWMHAPVQRLLKDSGQMPPTNPYFPDLVLQGHFVRDLLIVVFSKAYKMELLPAQWWVTNLCQITQLLAFFTLLRRRSDGPWPAWGALGAIFLGVNALGQSGLAAFYLNNTCVVYLNVATAWMLADCLWERRGRLAYSLTIFGLFAGQLAQTYETHFGLLWLSLLSTLPWLTQSGKEWKPIFLRFLGGGLLSICLACSLGGAFTDLLTRPERHASNVSNQSQETSLHFPKQPLFGLRVATFEIHPVSCGFSGQPFRSLLSFFDGPASRLNQFYVPIYSKTVVRMHWLGLFLAPCTLVVLLRRDCPMPVRWLWFFGAWAYLVPGLVDFGPIHEMEYLRWEFGAGFGLAGALGWWAGQLLNSRRTGIAGALLMGLLIVPVGLPRQWELLQVLVRSPWPWGTATLTVSQSEWLRLNAANLHMVPQDVVCMQQLAKVSSPGQAVLINDNPGGPWGILVASTMTMVSGCRASGHQLPGPDHPVGLPPHQLTDNAMNFLREPDRKYIRGFQVDFLYLRYAPPEWIARLRQNLEVELVIEEGPITVFRLRR